MICPSCGNEVTWEYFDGTNNPPMICFECGFIWDPTPDQTGLDIDFTKDEDKDG